jgi:spore coat protein A
MDVDAGKYRLRMLNGCDGVTLTIRFIVVKEKTFTKGPLPNEDTIDWTIVPFKVIGGDQGLAKTVQEVEDYILVGPAARYDIVIDFTNYTDSRIILQNVKNITDKTPTYADLIDDNDEFQFTDRIMAFDVNNNVLPDDGKIITLPKFPDINGTVTRTRKVGLFKGTDPFGREQALLGTVGPATNAQGQPICWPDGNQMPSYKYAGLAGRQMSGTSSWHDPTTENPKLNDTEIWEIWNFTPFPHPIHVHLVWFSVLDRYNITYDSGSTPSPDDRGKIYPEKWSDAKQDGTFLTPQPLVEHSGRGGQGWNVFGPFKKSASVLPPKPGVIDKGLPQDIVLAYPGEVTVIKMNFDLLGRYVWHCHILSHEDHEMMRYLYVGNMTEDLQGGNGCMMG